MSRTIPDLGTLSTPHWGEREKTRLGNVPGMGNRLRELRESRNWTHEQAASALGMSRSGYVKLERGERRLSDVHMQKAADVYGVQLAEILEDADAEGFDVPLLSWISAGQMMREDVSDEALGRIRVTDLPPGDWIALEVRGDSMDRVSPPESKIFVDRRDKHLTPNALYVIADEDGNATYKRYRPGPPMRFEPVSTNPANEAIFPEHEPLIVGRVKRSVLDTM